MQKNVAGQYWIVFAFDETDGTPKTGDAGNITAKISKDGAAGGATDDTNPTEIEDGYYVFTLTQAETNADMLLIMPESSTADIQVVGQPVVVYTRPPNFEAMSIDSNGRVDVAKIEGSDATDQIRDAVVDDATRIDGSALNTLSGHDPGETIMGASDLATEMGRIDAAVSTRSSHAAADVWAVGTRTLTSFGTLVADVATAVWSAVSRTLTAFAFTPSLDSAYDAAKTAAQAGDAMTLADDAITSDKFDESTAFPLKSADSGATEVARTGADGDTLESLSDQLDGVSSQGAGAITFTYTLTDADTGNPIADADVWVTSDEAGANVLASGTTDQAGQVVFYLDAGTVYVWRKKTGWNFTNPDTETVA